MAAECFTYTDRDGDIVPDNVTHVRIHESVEVIPRRAFHMNYFFMEEVDCHNNVGKVEGEAFVYCISLRRFIMPGVKVIEDRVFCGCIALADVECGKLEMIGEIAFQHTSLGSIDLPSIKIVKRQAFDNCKALTDVKFGDKLESIEGLAFARCPSLERINIPLKDHLITHGNIFQGCENLKHVDLVGGIHETVATLHRGMEKRYERRN
eukprot:scaffold1876_cov70-Skeletonema_marinoi.AAC.2